MTKMSALLVLYLSAPARPCRYGGGVHRVESTGGEQVTANKDTNTTRSIKAWMLVGPSPLEVGELANHGLFTWSKFMLPFSSRSRESYNMHIIKLLHY